MREFLKTYNRLIYEDEQLANYVQEHSKTGTIYATTNVLDRVVLLGGICSMLGQRELHGREVSLTKFVEKQCLNSLYSAIASAASTGKKFTTHELTLVHADGAWLYSTVAIAIIEAERTAQPLVYICLGDVNSTRQGTDLTYLIESMIDLMYTLDENGIITYTSPSFVRQCGYAPNELLGKSFTEYSHPEDTERCWLALINFRKNGEHEAIEHRIRHKDGEWHWYISSGALSTTNNEVILSSHEITNLKKSEQKAKNDALFYKTIQENQSIYILKLQINTGIITYVNDFFCKEYHLDKISVIGRSFYDILHKDDIKLCIDEFERCRSKSSTAVRIVLRSPIRKSKLRYVEWEFTGITLDSGQITELLCIGLNITEKIEVEKSLKEEKQLLRTIIDIVPACIYVKDRFGRKTLANKAEWELVGAKSEEEVLGMTDRDLFPNLDVSTTAEYDRLVLESNKNITTEGAVQASSGKLHWMYISKVPFKNVDGETVGIVGVSVDMTDRKKMEEMIAESEEKFRFISENISDAIMVINGKKTFYVSPTFERLFGYTPEEVEARGDDEFYDYVHPDDVDRIRKLIEDGMDRRHQNMLMEYRYRHKDGRYLWREDSTNITYDEKAQIERAIIVARDISDRKRVEEELQFTQYAIENTSDALYWIRPDGSFYFVNRAACDLVGLSQHELLKLKLDQIDNELDAAGWHADFKELKKKTTLYRQSRFVCKDGSLREIEINSNYILYKGAEYNCAFVRDIADRKSNELQLLRTKEMLEQVGKLAKVGGWEYNTKSGVVSWTEMTRKLHEAKKGFSPTLNDVFGFFHGEKSVQSIQRIIEDTAKTGVPSEVECQIKTQRGKLIWVQFICNAEFDNGECVRLFGSYQDITEKKLVQLALQERNDLLAVVAEGSQELLQSPDYMNSLRTISARLGMTLQVDRVYIFQANYEGTEDFTSVSQRLEWSTDDVEPQIDNPQLQYLPRTFGEGFIEPLLKGKPYRSLVKDIEDEQLKALLTAQDIVSILVLPLWEGRKLWGFIGFDDCKTERVWRGEEYTILQSFAATLSHAIMRKSVEDKITTSRELLQKLTNNIPGAVFQLEFTSNGTPYFPFISEGIRKFESFPTAEEVMADSAYLLDLILPEDKANLFAEIHRSANNMLVKYLEFRTMVNGETKWYSSYIRPEKLPNGSNVYYGYFQDINERKLKNEALQRLVDISADQNKRLLNFAYIISHNIRAHTSNLSSILSIWEYAESEEEKRQYMSMLHQSMEKLDETITNLNEIITIQRDVNTPTKTLSLRNEIDRAILAVNNEIVKYNAEIKNEVPSDISIKVIPAYLDSILLNLLTNALKYRSKDRVPVIRIFLQQSDNYTILHVKDNGQGINLEKYGAKLFGLYKTFHGNEDARGLGLFLIKNQIESMRGKIEVESQINVGTTFKVYFYHHD